jgi:cellobiose dehydrogenase (acceptor)
MKDDWDLSMPPGFRSADMVSATRKAFSHLPWTSYPSKDGKDYLANGTYIALDTVTSSSLPNPYRLIQANKEPDSKNHTVSLTEYFISNGERGGPMATYLVTASQRKNFRLHMNTTVKRITRTGEHISGVEVEASGAGGLSGTINLTPHSGRVILSAGVFGTAKILFRSGIGPREQLQNVQQSSDGPTMLGEKYWIDSPVGHNLDDSPAIYLAAIRNDIETYDWEGAYNSPNEKDVQQYLKERSGLFSMIQPSLGPVFWDRIRGADNRTRIVQWDVNSGKLDPYGGMLNL